MIVASVSCIYGLGAPVDYGATVLRLRKGGQYRRDTVLRHLVEHAGRLITKDELFTAEKGGGSYLNGRRLKVSAATELLRSMLVTGFPYDLRDDLKSKLRLFNRFMGEARAIRRDGAAAQPVDLRRRRDHHALHRHQGHRSRARGAGGALTCDVN